MRTRPPALRREHHIARPPGQGGARQATSAPRCVDGTTTRWSGLFEARPRDPAPDESAGDGVEPSARGAVERIIVTPSTGRAAPRACGARRVRMTSAPRPPAADGFSELSHRSTSASAPRPGRGERRMGCHLHARVRCLVGTRLLLLPRRRAVATKRDGSPAAPLRNGRWNLPDGASDPPGPRRSPGPRVARRLGGGAAVCALPEYSGGATIPQGYPRRRGGVHVVVLECAPPGRGSRRRTRQTAELGGSPSGPAAAPIE